MRSTFFATLRTLIRNPIVVVWTLVFPVVLSTLFMLMFQDMRTDGSVDPVPVAVVADAAWEESAFAPVAEALAEGDEAILSIVEAADADAAYDLFTAGEVDGVLQVDAAGEVKLTVAPESSAAHQSTRGSMYDINRSILEVVASSYAQTAALMEDVAADDPQALADPVAVAEALALEARSERVSLTVGTPDETVRYYYALLGMATMFAANLSLTAVAGIQPRNSAAAARRSIAGVSRTRQIAGATLASWLLAFIFLSVAFCYIRLVVGVEFAGREGLCLVGIAAGSLLATGLGAAVGALPVRENAATGILTCLTVVLSIFAGLYGEPVMELADAVAEAAPLSAWINPAKLMSDLFYSLYYYESLVPFAARVVACVAGGAVLFALAIPVMRRQRYAHL